MDTKLYYDAKYDKKPVLMKLPKLQRIKHRISFSGSIIVCLILYIIVQYFGHKVDDIKRKGEWCHLEHCTLH